MEPIKVYDETDVKPDHISEPVYAKDQPEYLPLPCARTLDGEVTTRWRLSAEEIARILDTGELYLTVATFNQPLQPILLTVRRDEILERLSESRPEYFEQRAVNEKAMQIWAQSIFGAESGKGLVELEVAGAEITIAPTEARAFAYSILEAAEAAETDEFIMMWLEKSVKDRIKYYETFEKKKSSE